MKKSYYEKIIDEIVEMIKDNLVILYNFQDETLITMREYCKKYVHKRYKKLPYNLLISFTEEAMGDLINAPYMYDLRELE